MRETRINALKDMLQADPKDAFALYGLALEYKAAGDLEAALPLLVQAAALPEPEVYTFYQLGEVLIGLGEDDDAETALRDGLQRAEALGDGKAANELAALLASIL